MKKLLLLAAIFAVVFTACPTDDGNGSGKGNGNGNGGNGTTTTTLRIKNESSKVIRNVIWNNVAFNDSNTPINSGSSIVKTLEEGTGYIFFDFYSVSYRTSSVVAVEKDENAEFTFTNNTVIIEVNNANNSITIGNLPIPPTNLTVTNQTTYDFSDVEYGNVKFGSVNKGSSVTKEVSPGTRYMEISIPYPEGIFPDGYEYLIPEMYITTAEMIICEEGMVKQFTVASNTNVTSVQHLQGTFNSVVDSLLYMAKPGHDDK